ncbi:MAG: TetR/AcrR family transcriptional regulator [Ferrovibrio sp.]|uniref:TetR/AcrR family transcriptional regulator n=1 Tax=Ferrovibrio sp. TaxID=1917215 RepID=UPI002613C7AF|nr:TetR/AcrR family transcriptional regulator [Ferrovibrio sp.]MCW0232381.1 TetR/AcrR family transcriptional regulator [Ferrovibrio sp.]
MTKLAAVSQAEPESPAEGLAGPVQDRLLDAALACFRRLGGKRTRIEDIAAEAGIARTAVYRHYQNKRAIVAGLATRWLAEDETRLAAIARDHGRSPAARLQAFLLMDAENTRRYLSDPCLVEVLDEVMRNLAGLLRQHRSHIRRHLAGLLAEGSTAGAFRGEPAEKLAVSIDDLMSRFHDPRLAADLDKTVWHDRATAAVDMIVRTVRAR